MTKAVKENLIPLLILFLVILFTFWNLPQTFYQQDEWQTLGHNLVEGIGIFANLSPLSLLFGERRPFSGLMYLFFLGFYKFTLVPIAIFAIAMHLINVILVFFLTRKVFNNVLIAFLASLFFAVNSVSHQTVTWASAIGTLPAATLILMAVLTYLKYFKTAKRKYLLASFLSTILSLYFKGVGLFLFILLPAMFFIYKKHPVDKKNIEATLKVNLPLLIFGFLMLVSRFGTVFFRTEKVAGFVSGGGNDSFIQTVFLHLILYPLTSLFQVFVPPLKLYQLTEKITKIQYQFLIDSPLIGLVAQSVVADLVAVIGSVIILSLLIYLAVRYGNKVTKKAILFSLLLFFLSFLPYAVLNRSFSYLESRYYYLASVGGGIIFAYIVIFLAGLNKYLKWPLLALTAVYLYHHASIVRRDINYQVDLGRERRAILESIKKDHPRLGKKTVFYVTSNKTFLGEITNPFQNGLGYILEIWYYDSGNIPKDFLKENFLFDLGSEGYREIGGFGFGYFQDLDKMAKALDDNNLSPEIVHAYFYNSKTKDLINNTEEIKQKMATISAWQK